MRILVTGGAGYIGSYMVKLLTAQGHDVVTFDNLSTGFRDAVQSGRFVEGDLGDPNAIESLFEEFAPQVVMHFAGYIQVRESVIEPSLYYQNNFCNTIHLLNAMVKCGVPYLIFSSTAGIFGEPEYNPIDEQHPRKPVNPYGMCKHMVEQALKDYDAAYGLKSVSLRYFNAAGADPRGELGERHEPESHLIPLVLKAASGRNDHITIFGTDFDTFDGSCIRDYIHIHDLCAAHLLAMEFLVETGKSDSFNLGNSKGYSVRQVVETASRVTGITIPAKIGPPRKGEPGILVADSEKSRKILGWKPVYSDLETIIEHAWLWEKKNLMVHSFFFVNSGKKSLCFITRMAPIWIPNRILGIMAESRLGIQPTCFKAHTARKQACKWAF